MKINTFSAIDNRTSALNLKNQSNALSENVFEFLNPIACRNVNPYSNTFWQDMQNWLSVFSKPSADCPKAENYRSQLEPYLSRRVNLVARNWEITGVFQEEDAVQMILKHVRLSYMPDKPLDKPAGIYVSHMHVKVSISWLKRVAPDSTDALSINGLLYEYINSNGMRNIGVWPVTLAPRSYRICSQSDSVSNTSALL